MSGATARDPVQAVVGLVFTGGLCAWMVLGHHLGPRLDPTAALGPLGDPIVWGLLLGWAVAVAGLVRRGRGVLLPVALVVAWSVFFVHLAAQLGGRLIPAMVAGLLLHAGLSVWLWHRGTRRHAGTSPRGRAGLFALGGLLAAPFVVLGPPSTRWVWELGQRGVYEPWADSRHLTPAFAGTAIATLVLMAVASWGASWCWGRAGGRAVSESDPG